MIADNRKNSSPYISTEILHFIQNIVALTSTYYFAAALDWENCEIPGVACINGFEMHISNDSNMDVGKVYPTSVSKHLLCPF
jgi:hypothetical protein